MKYLTLRTFEEEVIKSDLPTVVIFKNQNCYLCKGLGGVASRLRMLYHNRIKFCYIETSIETKLADTFKVDAVPTVFIFKNNDAYEIKYPENPSPTSGYSEKYLVECLDEFLER
jgi:thioredoxin-like negative regulator of GroEL|tara:strand:- start:52 stop:393 length:342 start_codon:yes stop_codon:yes gene_type:complete